MSDDELDEGQKKFIEAAGISTAEFLRLGEVYEKISKECQADAHKEYGCPEPDRKTLQMLAEMKSAKEKLESIQSEEHNPEKCDEVLERYLPTKEMTKEIVEIAKEQGDELDDLSLKLLDDALFSGIAPMGDPISDIKNASTVVKDLLDLGKIHFLDYAKHLGTFGAVAGLLKDILTWGEPKKKDPVLQELGVLKSQLEFLSSKMEVQFNELKAFMVEQTFFTTYADSATALNEYMVRTMQYVGADSLDDFKKHYGTIDPEYCVTRMLIMLERDSSNPLKVNMKGAELPSKEMFNRWKDILDGTMTQFLILEDFASGFMHPGNERKKNIIVEKITRFTTLVKKWEEEYLDDRSYIGRIPHFVKRIQRDDSYPKDEDKAEVIYNNLNGMLTRDNFYVVVFHKDHYYDYRCTRNDQLIFSTDTGSFHVAVFCVFTHSTGAVQGFREEFNGKSKYVEISPSLLKKLVTAMKEWVSLVVQCSQFRMPGFGFFMGVGSGNVATRWPRNFKNSEQGPGWFSYDYKLKCVNFTSATYNLYYIVTAQ